MAGEITVPSYDSLIETDETNPARREPFYMAASWRKMFFDPIVALLNAVVKVVKTTSVPAGTSAAVTTATAYQTTRPGLFRVSYIIRVTRPATTSSALQVTIGWVSGGVAQTKAGASLTGNLITTYETDSFIVRADGLTDVTYAVSYGSVGGTTLQYQADVVVEALS